MLFYLVGIKGSALSALAKILVREGHIVAGVDTEEDFYTSRGLDSIHLEHFGNMNLKKSYYYIIGNAFVRHSVTRFIQNKGYKYEFYPLFLQKHFKNKKWLCIAGTHGKTTSTKMLSTLLKNTTSLIGDGSMQYGLSEYFIIEACEYRNTFLNYTPFISLILNVDYDHVDFFKTKEDYERSFIEFASKSGLCVVNGDVFSYRGRNVISYGRNKENEVVFTYEKGKVTILKKTFYLPITGLYYAYDFVGVYLMAKLLNFKDYMIQNRIDKFKMPRRRLEILNKNNQVLILDYAHHPNEIRAVLETIGELYEGKKRICIFEPHTISRLQCFLEDFKNVLNEFDYTLLDNLFSSARERHNIVLEKQLYKILNFPSFDFYAREQLKKEKDCVICFLGAGDIDKTFHSYVNNDKLS